MDRRPDRNSRPGVRRRLRAVPALHDAWQAHRRRAAASRARSRRKVSCRANARARRWRRRRRRRARRAKALMAIVARRSQLRRRAISCTGARGAYELIVNAFAKGDREALRGLLTPRVLRLLRRRDHGARRERRSRPGTGALEERPRSSTPSCSGDTARVTVKFEAELAEGAHGVRDARERWTFERDVRSPDPNWRLARVQAA